MAVPEKNIGLRGYGDYWELRVWAPDARQVQLKLEATAAAVDLIPQEYGYWELKTSQINEGDRYWLLVDGKQLPDPAAVSQPEGVKGPSQARSLKFNWEDQEWNNLPLNEYIFYELHTGTFSGGGDFKGIAEKLDHLVDLGITAISLMPVGSFPGERNWGYDGVFPFAVQCSYGGPAALQELVCLCHLKGLAVVLDVVYNHLGPEGNYLAEFGPYFTDKYQTPWGNAVNFDDRNAYGVRAYFIENVLMWFRDFHIDALRLDAVHAIKDFSAVHILQEIRARVDQLIAETGKVHYLIAECDLNDPRYISDLGINGLGMDAQWTDEFHHALRVAAGEPRLGYYADFNGIQHLGKAFRDAYVYTGAYSAERGNFFGRSAGGHPGHQFIVFSQNHDQVGNRPFGERSSRLFSFEMQKLMAATVLWSPFQPLLFMGEEWGETNPFLYFIDHQDQKLVDLVRKGRKEEFAKMHTAGEALDPKDENTYLSSRLNWNLLKEPAPTVMLLFYKALISLRKQNPLLRTADRNLIRAFTHPDKNCLLFERRSAEDQGLVFCLLNFSASVQQLPLPAHIFNARKLIDSADPIWLGPLASQEEFNAPGQAPLNEISIQPQSFLAYSAFYV